MRTNHMFLNRFLCALPLGLCTALALPPNVGAQQKPRLIVTLDRIVAVVNDEVITRNDLSQRVAVAGAAPAVSRSAAFSRAMVASVTTTPDVEPVTSSASMASINVGRLERGFR